MAIEIISGNVFRVETDVTTEAAIIFGKYVDGTATPEEEAMISATGESAFEVKREGDHDVTGGV